MIRSYTFYVCIFTPTRSIDLDMTFEYNILNRNGENNTLKISSLEIFIFLMKSCEADCAAER